MEPSIMDYNALMSGSTQAINQLYDVLLPKLRSWVSHNSGNRDDALDVLHDALSALIINHHKGKILNVNNIEAYIFQMCKYQWYSVLKKRKSNLGVTFDDKMTDVTEASRLDTMIEAEQNHIKYQVLEDSFMKLTKLCRQLLDLVKQGKKATQIAKTLNMNSQSTVNRRKSACMDAWRKYLSEDARYHLIK